MLGNYLRRLSLTTKIALSSLFSLLVILALYIIFNILFFGILKIESTNYIISQFFSSLEILGILSLSLFIVSGFHFILIQLSNLPYSDYKLEITTGIFFILNFLLVIPTAFTATQFELSPSLKLVLDTIYMMTGSIYLVLAAGVFYMDLEGNKILAKRYTRWSVLVFLSFFFIIAMETVRYSMELNILLTFTGINLLLILVIMFADLKSLLKPYPNYQGKTNSIEIISFLLLNAIILIGKTLHLVFVSSIFG
jgi:hypothetical protein